MSQTKYKLPDDLKAQCISLVRGHKRRTALYNERRDKVIHSTPQPNIVTLKKDTGEIIAADFGRHSIGAVSDSTYSKTLQLEEIEQLFDTQAMKAVEKAKAMIADDYVDDEQREKLVRAIWDSCVYGRNFNLEYYSLPIGRDNFYERRRKFLYAIAKNMAFI